MAKFPAKSLWRKSKEVIEERKVLLACKLIKFKFVNSWCVCPGYRIFNEVEPKY